MSLHNIYIDDEFSKTLFAINAIREARQNVDFFLTALDEVNVHL